MTYNFPIALSNNIDQIAITKSMLTQVTSDGLTVAMMNDICDHRKDIATTVAKCNMYVFILRGHKSLRKKTVVGKAL